MGDCFMAVGDVPAATGVAFLEGVEAVLPVSSGHGSWEAGEFEDPVLEHSDRVSPTSSGLSS